MDSFRFVGVGLDIAFVLEIGTISVALEPLDSNEQKPTDGEIYRKLRQYDAERNLSSKLRWKSRLRGIRPKSLKTLYKHEDLTDAFDALLDIPGSGMT
jgi:hypothetical protein